MKRFIFPNNLRITFISLLAISLIFVYILVKNNTALSPKIDLHTGYMACLDNNDKDIKKGQCLRRLAIDAITNYSVEEIDSVIRTISDSNKRQWCHEFMHYSGWEVYKKTGSIFDSFLQASNECDSGMYHGIVEEYINQTKISLDADEFISIIPQACEGENFNQNLSSGMKSLCYHGLGHAFMLITDNNLNESLKYCDYLSAPIPCYTGTFMENTQSKQVGRSNHPSKFSYDRENPDYPCSGLDEKYKDQCYIYKGISNVVQTGGDFKQAFKDCLKVMPQYQNSCFWGVGSNIPGPHWSTQTTAEKCSIALEISQEAYEQCIYGAMSFVVQLNLGDPKAATEFCEVVDKNYKDICYRAAGISLGGWVTSEETLEQKCKQLKETKAQKLCQEPHSILDGN